MNIIKYARIIGKILAVLRVVVIVVSALVGVALVVGVGLAQTVVDSFNRSPNGSWRFVSGVLQLTISPSATSLTAPSLRWTFALLFVALALVVALVLRLIRLLADMMAEMQSGRPFSPSMTQKVRHLAWVILVYAFVTPLVPMIPAGFMIGSLRLPGDLPSNIQIGYQYNVNSLALVAGLAILLLSLVFDYGARLQQESDETL